MDNEWTIEPVKIHGIQKIEATYFMSSFKLSSKDTSQYIVTEYYKIDELKNHCIHEVFRNKSVEEWLNVRKYGKWKYWNKNGMKTREVIYEHGQQVKETLY